MRYFKYKIKYNIFVVSQIKDKYLRGISNIRYNTGRYNENKTKLKSKLHNWSASVVTVYFQTVLTRKFAV